jgi:uncharacterized spore protein YtfJ
MAMDVNDVLTGARSSMSVTRVFGEPIERDGVTVIPAAIVSGGGGGGGGPSPDGGDEGGGAGFGVRARPAGAFVIRSGEVTWKPALDPTRIGRQVVLVIGLLTLRRHLKQRSKLA